MTGMKVQNRFAGHRAVITGASSGIGEAFARRLAAKGADLVLVARRRERLDALAAELSAQSGRRIEVIPLDLEERSAARTLLAQATAGDRPVTLLVNNAGIGPYLPFAEAPLERHLQTIQLNVIALTELMHAFAAHMLSHGKPSKILNVASIAAYQASPRFAVYAGTKQYVRALSQTVRYELRNSNVGVSCLCPGGTLTEFSAVAGQKINPAGRGAMMTADAVVRSALDGLARNRGIIIPGLINWLACFFPRFLPEYWGIALAGKTMDRAVTPTQPAARGLKGA